MEPVKKDHAAKPARAPAATAEELRQFIGQMHGKSPQEVLGEVAESGLTRGIITSSIAAIVILVVFTVGPFLVNKLSADTAPPATAKPQQATVRVEPDLAQANTLAQASESQAVPQESDLRKATDAMGIGETKTADPDKNPMDKRLDSLLDGVD